MKTLNTIINETEPKKSVEVKISLFAKSHLVAPSLREGAYYDGVQAAREAISNGERVYACCTDEESNLVTSAIQKIMEYGDNGLAVLTRNNSLYYDNDYTESKPSKAEETAFGKFFREREAREFYERRSKRVIRF